MNKKKVFQSKSLNRLVLLDRLVWLIPVAGFLWNLLRGREAIAEVLKEDSSLPIILTIIFLFAFATFVQTITPFLILKILLHCARKQMMRNNTFRTVEDFDYYRDKLTGLSPGAISLISDLKLEQQKDIAASILKYKEMGVLEEVNGSYVAHDLEHANLRQSDIYLINRLVQHSLNEARDLEWNRLIEQEAIEDGYITKIGNYGKKGCGGCFMAAIIPVILFVIMIALCVHMSGSMDGLGRVLDQAPTGLSLSGQLEYLSQYPQYFTTLGELVAVAVLLFLVLASPFAAIAGVIGSALNVKLYKRTKLGNEMAECIYGMKNFIHDYSNLNQAEQEHVALWDDYLIYAVVLEENQQIIDDIMRKRRKL